MNNNHNGNLFSSHLSNDYPGRLAIIGNGGSCTYEDMRKGWSTICPPALSCWIRIIRLSISVSSLITC